jgi:hypothetical protein
MQPRRRSTSAAAFVAAVSVVFVGCDDATTDPLARLVAEETAGALAIGVELPDPGSWDVPTDIAPEDADALARWAMSWEGPASLARETRETAYSRLAALFAARLGRGGIAEQAARLGEGVHRAAELPQDALPDRILTSITEASREHTRAVMALRMDRAEAALEYVMRGSDALREVGPEAIARTLVNEVDEGFGRISPGDAYSEQDLERLKRLVRGGQEALREQDWVLAIRRAFNARGLLRVGDSGASDL